MGARLELKEALAPITLTGVGSKYGHRFDDRNNQSKREMTDFINYCVRMFGLGRG